MKKFYPFVYLTQFTYLTQFFWLLIFYISFYVLLCYNGVPIISRIAESQFFAGFLPALYSITLAIPFSLLFSELLPMAECAPGDGIPKPGVNSGNESWPTSKWAVPVAIAVGGAKVIEKLPPRQRLPALGFPLTVVTFNTVICAAEDRINAIPKFTADTEPSSPRGGPFSPFEETYGSLESLTGLNTPGPFSPLEEIYGALESFPDMSPYDQLEFMIKFMDALALLGCFTLSVYTFKMLLSNEKLHSYLVEKFPLPNYLPWFEKVLSFFKLPGVISNCFFLVLVVIIFWDIHYICVILLKALGSSS